MNVYRIYVEKKPSFDVKAQQLKNELSDYLGVNTQNVRILVRYDVENIDHDLLQKAIPVVFSEPPVDNLFLEKFPANDDDFVFSVEFLPGQYDQRADSASQCVQLLAPCPDLHIRTALTYVISPAPSKEHQEKIVKHCINPVDSQMSAEKKPDTLNPDYPQAPDVAILDGFIAFDADALKACYDSLSLAMTLEDMKLIQQYFIEQKRNPTITEIRVLDTYWSDHCRHTTFATELTDIAVERSPYRKPVENTLKEYLADHSKFRPRKPVCLMDLATLAAKVLKSEGLLDDQEKSEENNACSIVVPITINGITEQWLLNFKNETHNHPTEIEPFGGAATCLGGAIRDPLSGRTYVYQAMRVTGAADPTRPLEETIEGKLPQRKIVTTAAHGYSSYGNQIGLATGHVSEIYHPDYVAKRMEVGAVIAAAPRKVVRRLRPKPGDVVILIGGRTGRDGCGGATGASKSHNSQSLASCGAEVQKGNPPTERKIQRLFRRREVTSLIKRCNDFGAGGVSVAIGELAPGLNINLDLVPKKYAGLDGTELAISESQERMAVVVAPENVDDMLRFSDEENLEAVAVATVTEDPRMVITWRGKKVVDLERRFIDTNGAHQSTTAFIKAPKGKEPNWFFGDIHRPERYWRRVLADLNCCSKQGLVEMFDSSIGAGSVTMPFGGRLQLTPTQAMVASFPVRFGKTEDVSFMSYGFDPYLSSWSPFHGAKAAVLHSVAKIVAAGGDVEKIRLTFQEYFPKLGNDPAHWGRPLAALLGAYRAQKDLGLPAIGGKDSMSGTFNDIEVPSTLISFAVGTGKVSTVISPEFKGANHPLFLLEIPRDPVNGPDCKKALARYKQFFEFIKSGHVVAAYPIGFGGLYQALAEMSFGNNIGARIERDFMQTDFANRTYGDILFELDQETSLPFEHFRLGRTIEEPMLHFNNVEVPIDAALAVWQKPLEKVYPAAAADDSQPGFLSQCPLPLYSCKAEDIHICQHKVARPKVFIPVFPGTNCEYDSERAFRYAGADVESIVFRNQNPAQVEESVKHYVDAIRNAQIVMIPGGFSAGDEPDGSAKFITSVFRNSAITDAVHDLLDNRDGLMLGICNGFQALIKLGLLPYGHIRPLADDDPTLTFNTIGRHQSKMAYTRVVSNRSPWFAACNPGDEHLIPISHGEGRFVCNDVTLGRLMLAGQIATQYTNPDGIPTNDPRFNPNGSIMAIEGITSPDGRILGKMGHSERISKFTALNVPGNQDQHLFRSGVKYFL